MNKKKKIILSILLLAPVIFVTVLWFIYLYACKEITRQTNAELKKMCRESNISEISCEAIGLQAFPPALTIKNLKTKDGYLKNIDNIIIKDFAKDRETISEIDLEFQNIDMEIPENDPVIAMFALTQPEIKESLKKLTSFKNNNLALNYNYNKAQKQLSIQNFSLALDNQLSITISTTLSDVDLQQQDSFSILSMAKLGKTSITLTKNKDTSANKAGIMESLKGYNFNSADTATIKNFLSTTNSSITIKSNQSEPIEISQIIFAAVLKNLSMLNLSFAGANP